MEGTPGHPGSSPASPVAPLSSSGATSNFWDEVEDKFSLEGAQRIKKLFGQGTTRPVIQIIGAPAVGEQLATAGDLSSFRTKRDGKLMCKFQWLRAPTELAKQAGTSDTDNMGFLPIFQARKPRYCPQQGDIGYILKVEVTPQIGDGGSTHARSKLYAIAGPVMSSPLGSKDIAIAHRHEAELSSATGPVRPPYDSPVSAGEPHGVAEKATPTTATSVVRAESMAGSVAGSVGLHAELERWQQRASRLVAEKADAEEECRQAKMELTELKSKEERWTERYENWKTEVQAQVKAAAHAAWEVEKSEMQAEMRSLKSDVASEREQLRSEQRAVAERQAAVDRAMGDISSRKAEVAKSLQDIESQRAAVASDLKSLQAEQSAFELQVAAARRMLEAEQAESRVGMATAKAEIEAERKTVREELQAAARSRKEAESELAEVARQRDITLAGDRESARAEAMRAAEADVQSLKSQAAEQLARERAALEAEIAANRRQLEAERARLQAEKEIVEKEATAVRSSIRAEQAELDTLKESQHRAKESARAELERQQQSIERQKNELSKERQLLSAEREELEAVAARLSDEVDQHEEYSRQASSKLEQVEHERENQLREFRDMRQEFEREKERLKRETEAAKQEVKKTAKLGQEALEAAEHELDQKRLAMEDDVAELRVEAQALQQAARAERQAAREQMELERSGMEAERKRLDAERRSLVILRQRLNEEREELEIVEESQSKALAVNMAELQLSSNSMSRHQSEQAREKRALEADKKELERRAQQIKEERNALEDMRSRTYAELDTMRSELGQVQVEHSRVLDEREAVAQRHAELQSLYKRKEDELADERRRWERQLRTMEATKAELLADRTNLQDELVSYAQVVGSLEGQVKVWEQRWSQEQNSWELERQTVLRKIDDLMTERITDAKANIELEGGVAARDSRSEQLQRQLWAAQHEIQKLTLSRAKLREPAGMHKTSAAEVSLAPSLGSPASSSAPWHSSASTASGRPLRLHGGLMGSPSARSSPAASVHRLDERSPASAVGTMPESPSAAESPISTRPPASAQTTAVSETETDAIQALLIAEAAAYAAVAQLPGPQGSTSSSSGSASGPRQSQQGADSMPDAVARVVRPHTHSSTPVPSSSSQEDTSAISQVPAGASLAAQSTTRGQATEAAHSIATMRTQTDPLQPMPPSHGAQVGEERSESISLYVEEASDAAEWAISEAKQTMAGRHTQAGATNSSEAHPRDAEVREAPSESISLFVEEASAAEGTEAQPAGLCTQSGLIGGSAAQPRRGQVGVEGSETISLFVEDSRVSEVYVAQTAGLRTRNAPVRGSAAVAQEAMAANPSQRVGAGSSSQEEGSGRSETSVDSGAEIQRLRQEVAQLRAQAALRPLSRASDGSSEKMWPGIRGRGAWEEFDSFSREDLEVKLHELYHEVADLESAKAEMDRFLIQVAAEWEAAKARYDSDQSSMQHDRQKLHRLETKLSEERKDLLEEVGRLKLTEAKLRSQLDEVRSLESGLARKADALASDKKKLKTELSNLRASKIAEQERLASEAHRSTQVLEGEMEVWKVQEHKWEARRQKWQVKKAALRDLVHKLQHDAEKSSTEVKALKDHSEEKEAAMDKALRTFRAEEGALKSQLRRLQNALLQEVEKTAAAELEMHRLKENPVKETVSQGPVLSALRSDLQQLQSIHAGISSDMRLLQQMLSPNFWAIMSAIAQGCIGSNGEVGQPVQDDISEPYQGLEPIPEEPAEEVAVPNGDGPHQMADGDPKLRPANDAHNLSDVKLWPSVPITPKPDEVPDPGRIGATPNPPPGSVPTWEYLLAKYDGKSHIWGQTAQVLLADERTVGSQNALLLRQQWVQGQLRKTAYAEAPPAEARPVPTQITPATVSPAKNDAAPLQDPDGLSMLAVHFPSDVFHPTL